VRRRRRRRRRKGKGKKERKLGGTAQVVERLPALSSNPSTNEKKLVVVVCVNKYTL
jgi:hypothetical protein